MKRFSVYKFIDYCIRKGDVDKDILIHVDSWAEQAHGMTAEEMTEDNLITIDEWMEEVE